MKKAKKVTEAERIHQSMRQKLRDVFPDDNEEAWQWTDENYETHAIEQPADSFEEWMEEKYAGSDEFSQRLVRRMFAIWREMESSGFEANDMELYEHQKALFAWIALSTTTGVREKVANLLVRSPYGSGKSLVAGLVGLAFRQAQEEMILEGTDIKEVPSGVLLGLRKEHMLQNALGQQFAVLQPPYTVERADVNVYWKNLATLFGTDFSDCFEKPKGIGHGFYGMFNVSEDDENDEEPAARVERYVQAMNPDRAAAWKKLKPARRAEIVKTLVSLVSGEIIFIPDIYNVPQAEEPLAREESVEDGTVRYRGDSAFAFEETETYRVKATHRHLALNRETYTTQPNTENPAKMLIAYGTMVTRAPENIRIDIREEIMKTGRGMFIDEAGAFTPASLGDSMTQLSGQPPYMVGFTGGDRGIEGWERSPMLSVQKMIELGLMKPIAFQGIGDANSPSGQGSEEAWDEYRKTMFADEKTAKSLGLPQPHELDTVVVAPSKNVREYAHRIKEAHDKEGIPVKIWCFDPTSGDSRWSIVVNGFNAPKQKGDPRRVLVAPPSQMSEALHLHAECYDVLANMSKYPIDQTRGRLGHIRNDEGTKSAREKARTYFRIQYLEGAKGEAYIREIGKMMGIEFEDENEVWESLRCMIDLDAYERDGKRLNQLSKPRPIPDTVAVQKRKKRRSQKKEWTALRSTSPFMIEQDRKAAEREARKGPHGHATGNPKTNGQAVHAASRVVEKSEQYTATKDSVSVTLVVDRNGFPTNVDSLANGLSPYGGSFGAKVRSAHREGKRGQELASIALHEYIRISEVIARRSGSATGESSKYIGVRTPRY